MVDQLGKVTNPEGNEVELKSLLSGAPIEGVTDPSVPSDPVETADSGAPADPSESEAPNDSVASDAPAAPAEPDHPISQDSSVITDASSNPAPPDDAVHAEPNASEESAYPAEPATPADPEPSAEPQLRQISPYHQSPTLRLPLIWSITLEPPCGIWRI
ncbi:hypothetical protein BSK65_10655 [Paenibacillus odorifer]|uniref:Uncharacterized protein n=1 Tax=Paenibacillus odorifer TaxID=189426 RepID=A0A1R0ZJX4_9BACL|nr:hypothetical protein [Paenibacillus odorifer]OME71492.1 hypothetical protein BSK65_10655 [Paenibacillus odorifer]